MTVDRKFTVDWDAVKRNKDRGLSWAQIGDIEGVPGDYLRKRYSRDGVMKSASVGENLLVRDKYVYNKSDDVYVTFLSSRPKPLNIPGDRHRAMLKAYSNWDGQPATVNEMCRTFSFTRQDFKEYAKIHGWTHDLEPATSEELIDGDEDQIVENLLAEKRLSLFKKWSKKEWAQTMADAEKWRRFDTTVLDVITNKIVESGTLPPPIVRHRSYNSSAMIISTGDAHIQKRGNNPITGEPVGMVENIAVFNACMSRLLAHAESERPELLVLNIGGDFYHVDNAKNQTTNGTPQDVSHHPADAYWEGCRLIQSVIESMREIAPVKVVLTRGNHDSLLSYCLLAHTWALYRDSDVEVSMSRAYRQYLTYGDCLLGFTHGDGPKKQRLGPLMMQEARQQMRDTRNHLWFVQHLHQEASQDFDGVMVYQIPSISPVDDWHDQKGYIAARRALAGYVVDSRHGVVNTVIAPVERQ